MTANPQPAVADPQQQLAWEKRHRPRAALAALLGAIGLLVLNVGQPILQRDAPSTSGLETLMRAAKPGGDANLPSLQAPFFEYLNTKTPLLLIIGIGGFVGWLGVAYAVAFLGVSTHARLPTFRRWIAYVPIVGGVLLAVSVLMAQIGSIQVTDEFLSSNRTVEAAASLNSGLINFARLLYQLGTLAAAVGIVLVALNAMRTGLLTRMLGYLGIAAGAMLVLIALPIVEIFWLASLAVLLVGRWPGGELPAWRSGEAVPWPTPERPPPRQRRGAPAPSPEPAGDPATTPAPVRRKRKKRH